MKIEAPLKLLILCLLSLSPLSQAQKITIAVASNFSQPIKALVQQFEKQTSHKVVIALGSTAKHFNQILHGAPFDAFFAADVNHPKKLEQQGKVIANSRFTYAIGKLVLWQPSNSPTAPLKTLKNQTFQYLSLANPKLAPYGKAAQQVLNSLSLNLKSKLVLGENISQTLQFVQTGQAQLGFIAYSQLLQLKKRNRFTGKFWLPPQSMYQQITQQAVQLKPQQATADFLAFVKTPPATQLIKSYGYHPPSP